MKKLFATMIVAFMMATGLVAATGTSASAAGRCPYTGCMKTNGQGVRALQVNKGQLRPGQGPRQHRRQRPGPWPAQDRDPQARLGRMKIRTKFTRYRGRPKTITSGKLFRRASTR